MTTSTRFPVGLNVGPTRGYEREFEWRYESEPEPPLRPLIPVVWDGLWLNTGDQDNGLFLAVEDITGWLDSAPLDGNDVARVISDGAAWGPKVLRQRIITLTGVAMGPRPLLGQLRDQLAARAANREPALLVVGDFDQNRALTADVRAGTEHYRHQPLGGSGFRWQATLTAADPALYAGTWQYATLTNITSGTGRDYPRDYPWQYASPYIPNSALLRNEGNHPAPVYALYEGPLDQSALTIQGGEAIRIAGLDDGMQILVSTASLIAESANGLSRAMYILPGSRPLTVPPASAARWYMRSAGRGSITLAWRSTWV